MFLRPLQVSVLILYRYGDIRENVRDILGPEDGKKIPRIWGLNAEGELRTAWREIGLSNAWYMMGTFGWGRFYSKHLALRVFPMIFVRESKLNLNHIEIKAKQEGIFPGRYSAPLEM